MQQSNSAGLIRCLSSTSTLYEQEWREGTPACSSTPYMHRGRLPCIDCKPGVLSEQNFVERDIQALKEAVQLTRPEAIQALKHTHGDVNAALANELAAMGHHVSFVDDLVHSYAFQR